LVLHGWGRAAEQHAGIFGIALQIASGFAHLYTGAEIVPEPLASALGTMLLGLVIWFLARQGRGLGRFAPLAFAALAVLPLGGAGWVVGSRFFYLPAIGICWAAGEALSALGPAAEVTAAAGLILLGGTAAARRRQDVVSYDRRVAAARRAVAAGLRDGHRVFHIDGDVKDLDLAVKEDPAIAPADVLVLGDVPASFAIIPPDLREAASILIARPPLPPGGSYRFGDTEVVGLARRGDDPELSDVLQRFPDLRFIRLRAVRGGMVIARDLTAEIREQLDDAALDGAASGESE